MWMVDFLEMHWSSINDVPFPEDVPGPVRACEPQLCPLCAAALPETIRDAGSATNWSSRHLGMNFTNQTLANSNTDPNPLSSFLPQCSKTSGRSAVPFQHVIVDIHPKPQPHPAHRPFHSQDYISKSRAPRILGILSSPFLLQIVRVFPAIALDFFSEQCIRGKEALVSMGIRRRNRSFVNL